MPPFGFLCLEFLSPLFDAINADLPSSPRSAALLGSMSSISGRTRLRCTLSALDFVPFDVVFSPKSCACPDSSMLPLGVSRFGPTLPAIDYLLPGFLVLLHSFSQLESAVSVLDSLKPGSVLLPKSFSCTDFFPLVVGSSWAETAMPLPDLANIGVSLPARNVGVMGFPLPLLGRACLDSPPLLPGWMSIDSPLFLQSFSCPGLLASNLGHSHLGLSTPLRSGV